jgi:acetyltransferase-like isoleucine patch superfamily enzyme
MKKKIVRVLKRLFWSLEKRARHDGIIMGEHNRIESYFWSSAEPYLITIGSHCDLTENTKIYTHGGARVARGKYPNFDVFGKVVLGDRVYVGSGVQIMPGVTIGDNVLIAAGSVVTKSIPSNVVVAGNPAKYVCSLDEFIEKNLPYNTDSKLLSIKDKKKLLLSLPDDMFIKKGYIQVP